MIDRTELWTVVILLGIGSFFLRFVFLGVIGDRALPEWVLRHLRYTAVAVLPALVAPLVLWPAANGGEVEPARLTAAIVTIAVGVLTKHTFAAIAAGALTLAAMLTLLY
ncbi:AzlD domain-containing protein [Pseudooceanicola nanhaiensis]|uniref:AzlD domain-containing protein n=1 Tax=Pseudooceanicola nanhaiensis TaxID=375761 RepID=UPI001CD63EC2|nr:AzlD domain-containing protein [Pseudooceanicola nanhaiensis]MCA0920615.1 AzlD domain-containing protein [Pseudooceanicola nanhaiensis]